MKWAIISFLEFNCFRAVSHDFAVLPDLHDNFVIVRRNVRAAATTMQTTKSSSVPYDSTYEWMILHQENEFLMNENKGLEEFHEDIRNNHGPQRGEKRKAYA